MKRESFEFDCTYGRSKIRDTGYYHNGWYCVHGSTNVNFTHDEVSDGTDVEELSDVDTFSWSSPINSLEELIDAVES
jgi:hypothetical protein